MLLSLPPPARKGGGPASSCSSSLAGSSLLFRKSKPPAASPAARPPLAATGFKAAHHGSHHPALAEAAIARGDPPILRSVVDRAAPLADAVARAAGVSREEALFLLRLGAVYLGEHPNGPGGPLKWRRQRKPRARRREGGEEAQQQQQQQQGKQQQQQQEGKEEEEEEQWWRRPVAAGVPLRVHASPKRFTAACAGVRLLETEDDDKDDYVVICKPGGLPSMAHESNDAEHAAACAEAAFVERRERRRRRRRRRQAATERQQTPPQEQEAEEDDDDSSAVQLQLCHRLDTWTSGVLVLARHPAAAARFSEALRGGGNGSGGGNSSGNSDGNGNGGGGAFSEKTYLALTRGRPTAAGGPPLVAHMYDGPWGDSVSAAGGLPLGARGPRILSAADPGGGGGAGGGGGGGSGGGGSAGGRSWKRCELVVERAEPATESACAWADVAERRAAGEMAAAAIAAGAGGGEELQGASSAAPSSSAAAPSSSSAAAAPSSPASLPSWHLCTIRLVTGRTHQIRAQLAAAGHPIAGDSMYAPLAGVLACAEAASVLPAGGGLAAVRRAAAAQVSGAVGLHAWRLRWRPGGEGEQRVREYVARPPWEDDGREDEDDDDDDDGAAAEGQDDEV